MSASFARAAVGSWLDPGRDWAARDDAERLRAWAAKNRVLPQVVRYLPPDLRNRELRALQQARARRRAVSELIARACGDDDALLHVKGFAFERFHPGGETGLARRQFNDTDVQVRDLDAFFRLHEPLRGAGLRLGAMALRRSPDDGALSAAVRYDLDGGGGLGGETVDVDIGPLWLRGRAHAALPDAYFADASESPNGPPGRLAGRRAGLVRLLAEVLERRRVVLRDVLDFLALDGGEPLLHAADGRAAARLELARRLLAARASRLRRLAPALAETTRMSATADVGWPPEADAARLAALRVRDGLSELEQGFSHRGAFLLAGPRRVARVVARRLDPPTRMRRGDWMQLLPIAPAPRGPLGWLESAGDVVLRTPIGCFAPILFGTVDPERLSSLAALCDASLEISHADEAAHPTGRAR